MTDGLNKEPTDAYCREAWSAVCRAQAVAEFDPLGLITWANDRFLELVGYTLNEIVGNPLDCAADQSDSGPRRVAG